MEGNTPLIAHASVNSDDALVELVETLESIDVSNPLARLNETSISDGNGGRILL